MKKLILFILILVSLNTFAQEQQLNCTGSLRINYQTENIRVFKYPNGTRAEKIQSIDQALKDTPEQLMSSVLSATNLEWYNYNREKPTSRTTQDFNYIQSIDPSEYFFELKYKLSFSANGLDYCVIKYVLHNADNDPVGFAEAMKRIEGKWLTTTEAGITTLLLFMGMFETNFIENIFTNNKSDNNVFNNILEVNTHNNIVDLNGVLFDLEKELNKGNPELRKILDPIRLLK